MVVRVHVTAKDLWYGRRRHCRDCPVARALARVVLAEPSLNSLYMTFYRAGTACPGEDDAILAMLPNPPVVRTFIADFDYGYRVRPFAFELDLPAEVPLRPQDGPDPAARPDSLGAGDRPAVGPADAT